MMLEEIVKEGVTAGYAMMMATKERIEEVERVREGEPRHMMVVGERVFIEGCPSERATGRRLASRGRLVCRSRSRRRPDAIPIVKLLSR